MGSDYRFNDYNPEGEVTYYRLKQVDLNNSFKYSETIVIIQHNTLSDFTVISAFPNPAKEMLTVQLLLPREDHVELRITDLNGRVIDQLDNTYNKGVNAIEIPVLNYRKGMYLISILNTRTQQPEVIKFTVE